MSPVADPLTLETLARETVSALFAAARLVNPDPSDALDESLTPEAMAEVIAAALSRWGEVQRREAVEKALGQILFTSCGCALAIRRAFGVGEG